MLTKQPSHSFRVILFEKKRHYKMVYWGNRQVLKKLWLSDITITSKFLSGACRNIRNWSQFLYTLLMLTWIILICPKSLHGANYQRFWSHLRHYLDHWMLRIRSSIHRFTLSNVQSYRADSCWILVFYYVHIEYFLEMIIAM